MQAVIELSSTLYGEVPIAILKKVYEQDGVAFSDNEMQKSLPRDNTIIVSHNELIDTSIDLKNLNNIKHNDLRDKNIDYYIPSTNEVWELAEYGYIRSEATINFENYLRNRGETTPQKYIRNLWHELSSNTAYKDHLIRLINIDKASNNKGNEKNLDIWNYYIPFLETVHYMYYKGNTSYIYYGEGVD